LARISGVLLALTGVAAIAGLVYLPVWLHRHDPPPPSITKRPADVTVANVPDATLVGRHNGRRIWRIHAGDIRVAADGHTTTFVGIDRGTLYRNERPAASITAARAVYNDDTATLLVTGGLTLSSHGVTAHTSRIDWREHEDRVRCPEPVVIAWKGGFVRAESVETNTKMSEITGRGVSAAAQVEAPMLRKLTQQLGMGAILATFLANSATGQSAPPKYKEVRFTHADFLRWNQANDTSVYEGNVAASQGDTSFRADKIVYRKAENTATVSGHIVVENPKNRIEGDTAEVDFNAKTAVLKGANGVKVAVLPAPTADPKSVRASIREPLLIACKSVRYYYREKRAEAAGPITVTRKNQVVTGESGTYDGANEIVTITGNVHGKDEKNQTFDAPSVKMGVKEGAEWLEAPNVKATFFVKEEEASASPPR
jgi:lipopolysaccharide export system protein LptA